VTSVTCPLCLTPLEGWDSLDRWHWDVNRQTYTKLKIPAGITGPQRINIERGSVIRCPNSYGFEPDVHYLPVDYGRFGPPVVLGFTGIAGAGKSQLLAAMVGEIERGGLREYGINTRPIDRSLHANFLEEKVRPLLSDGKVLPPTPPGITGFADAFLITTTSGPNRVITLFDVAGGDLTRMVHAKKYLDIADGLFFIVDPTQIESRGVGDITFNNVLDLLGDADRLPAKVSAAIVLSKADTVRFEDPVARWLRSGDSTVLDAAQFVRESEDVYAFLYGKEAEAWCRPYRDCARATFHVVSSTGGSSLREGTLGTYQQAIAPRRVLRPLVAMLAMTGVLTGPVAETVGI